jgi:hypothetical protein
VNRSLPNSCNILATGKAATLAYTAYATDGTTVLAARVFGAMAEIGATAVYLGPDIVVDAALSGFVIYDADGSSGAAGTVVDVRAFEALTPVAAAALAAIQAATYSGRTYSQILGRLGSYASGLSAVTDNGNGTTSVAFKASDGTTTDYTITYTTATGGRTGVV